MSYKEEYLRCQQLSNWNLIMDLRRLLTYLGFKNVLGGSHHVFVRSAVEDMVNLQREGRLAKPYQVQQVTAEFDRPIP